MPAIHEFAKPAIGKSTLVRPRFSPGLLLQDDDLTLAIDYVGNLSRLLFKSLFGCGVICGFKITPSDDCGLKVKVTKGLALDCHGDPVQLPADVEVGLTDCPLPDNLKELWVAIKRKEYLCSPRDAVCAPEEEDKGTTVATRLRDGYEVRLFRKADLSKCWCGCKRKPEAAADPAAADPAAGVPAAGVPVAGVPAPAAAPAAAAAAAAAAGAPAANAAAAGNPNAVEPDISIYAPRDAPCYEDHYRGECACDCGGEWVILGRVYSETVNQAKVWKEDYSERRFIRPVLMRDPTQFNGGA